MTPPRRALPIGLRAVLAPLTALALLGGLAPAAAAAGPVPASAPAPDGGGRVEDLRIEVRDGPARDQVQSLDARWYVPAGAGPGAPAPAMLLAHGFGGTKESLDGQARDLAASGYAVLAYTARGFGASTGTIALNNPDYEVADAQGLLDWLAARPEVRLDGPGDPRVGVMGSSYGGALALLLAGYDRRVDATVPLITWNDLAQSLFPNSAGPASTLDPATAATPAASASAPDGVFKQAWGGRFFGTGSSGPSGQGAPGAPVVCGRLAPEVCAGYVEAAATGRLPAALATYLERSSPRSVTDRITAPTLLVQGEQDTLFGLDQADANARQIAAGGGRVAVAWFAGGHDGGEPDDDTAARIQAWLDHHVAARTPDPGTAFTYTVPSGVRARSAPTQRTVTAPSYPGLPGGPGTTTPRTPLPLTGGPQDVLAPAGGVPAALSNLPGLGGLAGGGDAGSDEGGDAGSDEGGDAGGGPGAGGGGGSGGGGAGALLGRLAGDVPGQAAVFATAPLTERTTISGTPRVRLSVAAVPGQPPPREAVLFGKLYDTSPEGGRTLLGNAVAPMRLPAPPPDGRPLEVTVSLPAVVATLPVGHRLEVAVSTTDQAYALPAAPSTFRIGLAGAPGAATLSVPSVPGEVRSGTSVPAGPLVSAGVLLLGVGAAIVAGRVVAARRRRRDREPGGDLAVDPALEDVPLVVRGLGKAWPSGLRAVDDVSFRVERGQVLGLLGPNGAGKTTALRMLLGLVRPSEGELRVFGVRVVPGAPVLGRVGAFVEGAGFLPHLSGRANLESYWDATGRPRAEAHLDEALAIAGLGGAVERAVRTYSQGMRQRLAIAQAMLGLPDLLVLDEPTNGLDPPQIHAMREVLRDYARSGPGGGRSVLVSSHMLAEVEQTCTHVVVMHHGRVVADGEVAELVAGGQVTVTVSDPADRDQAVRVARGVEGVSGAAPDEHTPEVLVADLTRADSRTNGSASPDVDPDVRGRLVRALVSAGLDVVAIGPRRRLEDAFLALISAGDARPDGAGDGAEPPPGGPSPVGVAGAREGARS